MTSIVAIDIETTGLDGDRDAIIEIAAVKFKGHRVEDEFSTLVNPGRKIPPFITGLTGIDDAMVSAAPRLRDIIHELEAFAGDAPVVGHNVRFDLGFLQKAGILGFNEVIDTYELAAVLMPSASRYNLGALGQQLGIPLPATHRALDDARVTHAAYVRLFELAQGLPLDTLAEIVRQGEPIQWDANWAFQQALRARTKEGIQPKRVKKSTAGADLNPAPAPKNSPPLSIPEEPSPLDPEETASILEYGGPFSQYFEAYEHRPEQVEMLKAVANALNNGNHLIVEAGTGVGKCLTGDTWVTFQSGARRQIGDIVASEFPPAEPIACIARNGKLAYQKIQAVHRNGVRPVWKLRTGLGRKITATANHPFLTFNGWRPLCELKNGDRIATIRSLPAGNLSYPAHEAFVAGAMLGDGGCGHPDSLNFTILDLQSKRLFEQTVGKYMLGKRKQRLDEWRNAHINGKNNTNDDVFPVEAWEHIGQEKLMAGKSWYAIRKACIVSSDRQREISRNKMLAMGEFPSSPTLKEAATSDLYWDRIVAIEPAGEAETFDLTMDGEPNFIANDIVAHNSFAYLIPAALFAMQNNTRVVVSTNTINLQDQLIQKDIPDLRAALGIDLRAAVLKGRYNYLCPRRLQYLRQHGPANDDELRVLCKVLVWQLDNQSGDRNELNLTGPTEREVWRRISAEDDACTTETCISRMHGACAFHRAKQASQAAHVLVVNHALLLADIATGSRVLPEYGYVIVDEAHHMESATTNALSFRLTQYNVERMTREVGGSSAGILGHLLTEMHNTLRPSDFGLLQQKVKRATDQAFRLEQLIRQFFTVVGEFTAMQREGQPVSMYAWQLRITPSARLLPGWENVEMMWGEADGAMVLLIKTLGDLYKDVASLYSDGHDNLEDTMSNISNLLRRMSEAETAANGLISKPTPDLIYWVEVNPRGEKLSLNAAPLRVGPLVQKYLWHEKACVVLTSATMTTNGEFQYIKNTLAAEEVDTLSLGSPFDYESSALLYIANDMPEPNVPGYQQAMDRGLIQIAKATGGRMLVLFTSYAALKKTSAAITGPLAQDDIFVFEQGEGASPNALLDSFKSTERAVLLGTRAFWEGVDVPGDSLSVVVIAKLPFDVPTDPLIAARSELYENPFNEYYLPESILKFRQGFGRLIRTASDRGIVVILDRRVLTKQYGRLFLGSLPQCTARQGPLASLPKMAEKWLGM